MRAASLVIALALLAPSAALGQSVADIARRGACSTAGVEGISRQLIETQQCMGGGGFVRFDGHRNIRLTSTRVHPFVQRSARDALHRAADRVRIDVNSAFRPVAEQYVLYHSGGCAAAASPGSSNHQSGRAVDLANWSAVRGTMGSAGCAWLGSFDPVHFDCPGTDRRSDSVRAFQRLWNVNHPGDRIAEDGVYGAATANRLGRSPAGGFARGGCCRAHCDGDVIVGADCARRRCADGRTCTMEGDGPRCVDDECRATPTGVVRECVGEARLRICRDGRADYRRCEDPNVCRADRCVDPECPVDGSRATLCATDGSLLVCEARRGSRLACGDGDVCEGSACVVESCVGREGTVCLDATTMGECAGGALVATSPCLGGCAEDASGARCEPRPCEGAEGAVCLDASTLGECSGGELVATETCTEGCVIGTDVGARCAQPELTTDAGPGGSADAGAPRGDDAGALRGGALAGGCSAGGGGSSSWWLALLVLVALVLLRRLVARPRRRSVAMTAALAISLVAPSALAQPDDCRSRTRFAPGELGDRAAWTERTSGRWCVRQIGEHYRYAPHATSYDPREGNRLGEHAVFGDALGDVELAVRARTLEDVQANGGADYALVLGWQNASNYYLALFHAAGACGLYVVKAGAGAASRPAARRSGWTSASTARRSGARPRHAAAGSR